MRTDEAFKILKNAAWLGSDEEREAVEEAVTMACNALATIEQITWERDTAIDQLQTLGYGLGEEPSTDGDLISRQVAINDLEGKDPSQIWDTADVEVWINELPSVQPDLAQILAYECGKASAQPTQTNMPNALKALDCVERQAAIDALFELYEYQRAFDPTEAADLVRQGIYLAEKKIEQLPSAKPEPIRINLNEPIKVKLTDWGKEIYYHQYDRINQVAGREMCKPKFPKEDENGYTEFQLWCFIELYGMHMGMTLPNVIEPLEIVYER